MKILRSSRMIESCIILFAEVHGMSIEDTKKLFRKYHMYWNIRRGFQWYLYCLDEGRVRALREDLERSGGVCPERVIKYAWNLDLPY